VEDERRESFEGVDEAEEDGDVEVVEGVVVLHSRGEVAPAREGPPPIVAVAAAAATGFVAGAATAAVLGRRFAARRAEAVVPAPASAVPPHRVVASRRYVVDVHTIAPR
jgi:hypothetical protein